MNSEELATLAVEEHQAMQKAPELKQLIDFLLPRPDKRNVLEIGGCFGGTMWIWGQLYTGKRICVDAFVLEGRMEEAEPDSFYLVRADSHLPATLKVVVDLLDGDPVDLLFIDGDHSLPGVIADFALYTPLVQPGGVIVIHDTAVPHENVEAHNVIPLWEAAKRMYPNHFQIFDPEPNWGGIGVLLP